jgi:hypothetical protein
MKLVIKLLIGILSGLALLAALAIGGFWLFLTHTAEQMCGNHTLSRYEMVNRQRDIVVFQRDCGATTGFSTQVSIIERDETLPNESGNTFIADTNHGKAPRGRGGGPEVRVELLSHDAITIRHPFSARVFKKESRVHGITISYGEL